MSTVAAPASRSTPVGELLRSWRRQRRLSQLELALDATVSARHVSFLETGRAKPSREMILHLAEHLDVPLRERNGLLLAAGYAPVYSENSLDAQEMAPARQALDRFLRAHEPYPALVIDRHHNLLAANDALATLTEHVAPDLLDPAPNALRIALHPRGMAAQTLNLGEWSAHLLGRLRREARVTGDPQLYSLYDELAGYPGVEAEPAPEWASGPDIVVPLRLRHEDEDLAFFSTIATFGTAVDVTLAEVAIEAFYPANAPTAARLFDEIRATDTAHQSD